MRIAAYCRVSTDKADQLNSLEAQKKFFMDYVQRTGNTLVRLYADEGISGTKVKKRKQFLQMMADAETGLFEHVVVKDISRFARNTVDLLQNIRTLKQLGIETEFLTANMTSMGNSEFVLTIFGALAQEESANTSKRIKFGKKINAEKGRIPNFVYGYDKTPGDVFNLNINEKEAAVIRRIFHMYTEESYGANKIGQILNGENIKTKFGNNWTQESVCRILTNEIYMGKVINGKVEVADFLTGIRRNKSEEEWCIVDRPELALISKELFERTQEIMAGRSEKFKTLNKRTSNRHLFSTLIVCKDCGWSFRQITRTYQNTYVRWVCSGRNGRGAKTCCNATSIDEKVLVDKLNEYFRNYIKNKDKIIEYVVEQFHKEYKEEDVNLQQEKELTAEYEKLKAFRVKYMDMFAAEMISKEEFNNHVGDSKQRMEKIESELKLVKHRISKTGELKSILEKTFKTIEDIIDTGKMTNGELRKIIERIEVDHDGNVDIYMKLTERLNLARTVPIRGCLA